MRAPLLYITNFLLTSSLGVVFVFLEDVQTANGLADWEIGVISASGFAFALVVQLALSPHADRGTTAPLAVVAMVSGIVGPIGFAYGGSLAVLATSRGLSGIGLGLFGLLARKALLGLDTTGGGAKLGMLMSTAVAGFIIGPLIGAVLEPISFEAPFIFVSAGIAVVGIPATFAIMHSEIASAQVDYSDLGRLLRRPRVQAAMIVEIMVFGFIGVFESVVDRFLTDFGASTSTVAVVILFIGAPMLVLPRISGNLAESRGGSVVMLPALLVLVPVMFGYGLAGSVLLVAIFGLIHGTGESFATIAAQVLVLEVTGTERAAVGSALLEASGLIAASIAAGLAPSMYGIHGQGLFVGTGVIGVALAALAFQRVRNAWD